MWAKFGCGPTVVSKKKGGGDRQTDKDFCSYILVENTNTTQNKSQTHRAKQYEVTSFLSTDCELSTEICSKNASVAEWLRAWDTLTMFEATVCGRS